MGFLRNRRELLKSYRMSGTFLNRACGTTDSFMQNPNMIRSFSLALCGCIALAASAPVFAQHGGGASHGGAAVAGGGHSTGGGSGGRYAGGYYGGRYGGYYGGRYGGYYGGYGWRGGYGWGGYYGPWGWGWGWGGVGLGLYFATLPYYYSTYWYGGVPYYYADNTYYRWDPAMGQYQTVSPPAGSPQTAGQGSVTELIVYPKNGQSQEQQVTDKYECYRWAVAQLGYDPTSAGGGTVRGNLSDYYRASAACLEGRGYTVK